MIVRTLKDVEHSGKVVRCPVGGFTSNRYLLQEDNMGFTMTKTVIPVNGVQTWHYKNHLEACFCISGAGILTNVDTGESFDIKEDTMYALDKNDKHSFQAKEKTVLICVFNPALVGDEVHKKDGSYKSIIEGQIEMF